MTGVQTCALPIYFRSLAERDEDIRRYLKPGEIARVFNVERYLKHVDEIFRRVFGKA